MQTEKIINHIVNWLNQYMVNSGQKGFVMGISGGIDSALVSTLCAKTEYPLLCLEMPIHQRGDEETRAKNHIQWLKNNFKGVESKKADLTLAYDSFANTVDKSENNELTNLALANTRARLRMTTLYYYATLHHYIVAGTGNKVEDFGIGFFTKYGDGGVDISPIGDLMKSEVRALAREAGIIEEIVAAKPTDGLFADGRSDEDQIGATYDELEWAMKMYENGRKSEEFSGRKQTVFDIYRRRHLANLHKIEPIPICTIPQEWK